MAEHVDRPMIFPLSNPTALIEAVPADLIRWTEGQGARRDREAVEAGLLQGRRLRIGQANNALIYPGIGLGTIVARAEPRDRRDAARGV